MKYLAPLVLTIVVIVLGAFLLAPQQEATPTSSRENVSVEAGMQVVRVVAKGGYQPRLSRAKAGMPTVLRMETSGTYDCSALVRIPSRNIRQYLPPTGETDIALGTPSAGTLHVVCGMGMYSFDIEFQS